MVYLIQAEEYDISYELLQQLAAALALPPELSLIDATHRVRHAYGVFEMPDETEAARVAKGFAAAGFDTIITPELFVPPPPEKLNLHQPELDGPVELAAAGELHLIREQDKWEYKPFISEYDSFIDKNRIDDEKLPHRAMQYCLDVFTAKKHWRARGEFEILLQECLVKLNLSGALLGVGAQHLLEKNRHLPTFEKKQDYELYISWLYQLRRMH